MYNDDNKPGVPVQLDVKRRRKRVRTNASETPIFYKKSSFRADRPNSGRGGAPNKHKRFTPTGKRFYESMVSDAPVRLNKFIANSGICSRREADDYIKAGVVKVNGEVVTDMGVKVKPTDTVYFHDQLLRGERKVYILLNKQKNTITTADDPQGRRSVLDIVHGACKERIYPVGRLDRNTTGVLLLTNDGDLAALLTHPKYEKRKVYSAVLSADLSEEAEKQLRDGIELDGEKIIIDALEFPKEDRRHIGIEIHSGQNRVVRRIFERVGNRVVHLDRTVFAGLTKKNLPRGKYRFLSPAEVSMLKMGAFK